MTFLTHFLNNLPIRRKLIVVILLTCSSVLLLALVALFVFQSITARNQLIRDMSELGRVIAHNSAAAAAFNDREGAIRILSGLEDRSDIEGACLVLENGEHVTAFDRGREHDPAVEGTLEDGHSYVDDDVLFTSAVALDGKRIGTLYLRADFRPKQHMLLSLYLKVLAIVLVASLLLAYGLANGFQRLITGPILHLAGVAQRVAQVGDYSLQAVSKGNDEVGTLTNAFNDMLNQIRTRDVSLQLARESLEERVRERTAELASSLSVLNATLESTADGIVAVHLSGKVVSFNSQFASMWNIPPDVLERKDDGEMVELVSSQVRDPKRFMSRINDLYASLGAEAFDVIELKDGRIFERFIKPQRVDGKSVGMVVNFRDITERKRAEETLNDVHKQLLETSRSAGMAEVATSVLHNVGNVLNSVNVSIGIATDKVSHLKSISLGRVAALVKENAGNLPAFFTDNPQGVRLPAFLSSLAEHFTADQEIVLRELASLRTNVEHINEIVAMQQTFAVSGGIIEELPVTDVVQDALRMNASALERHGTKVVCEFDASLPSIPIDRNKLLLILVNLIRNAKYACDDAGVAEKCITLRTEINSDQRAKISVSDNGIGIPPENLTRIFEHGFTTRKSGHGFGLHSSALAASEMGGSLHAYSDGTGHGAMFIIELPIPPHIHDQLQ